MFDSICIRQNTIAGEAGPIDVGSLAEAMLFYQKVCVVTDYGTLDHLLRVIGPELLIEFIETGHIEIIYLQNGLGVMTHNTGTPHERHDPMIYSLERMAIQEAAPKLFVDIIGRAGRGRRLARRFMSRIKVQSYKPDLADAVRIDFTDIEYIHNSIIHLLDTYVPDYEKPDPIIFNLFRDANMFAVDTNIDFELANREYHKRIPPSHSSLSPAYFLSHIVTARGDLNLSSNYSSELAVNSAISGVLKNKIDIVINRRIMHGKEISLFQDLILDNSMAIREAINSGSKSFTDLHNIMNNIDKFKAWLKDKDDDKELVREYIRELRKISWLDRLPGKSVRWALFTGTGLTIDTLGGGGIGTAMGIGMSAIDTFLLDKIINGWKPSQFVENTLSKFVRK